MRQEPTTPPGMTDFDRMRCDAAYGPSLDPRTVVYPAPALRRGDEEWHTASEAPATADPLDHRQSRQERTRAQHHGRGVKR